MLIPVVGIKMRSVWRMAESAVWGWILTRPSHRTRRPSTDAVVTRKRASGRVPVREFHSTPAWRNTSIGAMAVEENISSRNTTVTSITYVQWHICHLVSSAPGVLVSKNGSNLFQTAEASRNENYELALQEHSRCR